MYVWVLDKYSDVLSNKSGARVQNNHRTTMTVQRLSHLSLMAIENDVVRNLDINDVIVIFAKTKARKAVF